MPQKKSYLKEAIISLLIASILGLHYYTFPEMRYHHAIYRMLFYLPLVLGSLWFGMKGALFVCTSVSVLFLPYAIRQWEGLSYDDLYRLTEGVLYIIIALILGFLVEEVKKRHEALLRAESLSAVGRAVSEIAHNMKTPLMAIGGFATQVSKRLDRNHPDQKKLDIVIRETAELESMIREMLDFGKPLEIQPTETSLNDLVLETLEVARPVAEKAGVEIKAEPQPSLPSLLLDVPRIKQVLLNLCANAVQASPAGEQVTVRTRLARHGVILEVSDRGHGITEEHNESVFQPFFSTKKGGTGLGLGTAKKIVEAHGGEIHFMANPEKGTTFVVHLPLLRSSELMLIP